MFTNRSRTILQSSDNNNMLKLIVLAIAIRLMLLSSCTSMSVSKRGQVQLCGRMLAETLNLLCQGQYYDPGEENDISKRIIAPQVGAEFYPGWYFGLPPQRINELGHRQLIPSSRRQERGVVDECCKQSCSPSVLLSYCRPGK